MSLFSIAIMLKSQSLVVYFKNIETGENSNSTQVREQYLVCDYAKFQLKIPIFFGYELNFPRLIGNETGHLLECVELYGKFINKSET